MQASRFSGLLIFRKVDHEPRPKGGGCAVFAQTRKQAGVAKQVTARVHSLVNCPGAEVSSSRVKPPER